MLVRLFGPRLCPPRRTQLASGSGGLVHRDIDTCHRVHCCEHALGASGLLGLERGGRADEQLERRSAPVEVRAWRPTRAKVRPPKQSRLSCDEEGTTAFDVRCSRRSRVLVE